MRACAAVLLAIVAAACGRPAPAATQAAPRLVVLVVIDQLPDWAFSEKLPHLRGGFVHALARGRRYLGEYPYAATSTAPGHATLGTGAPPKVSGIIANDWWRPELAREVPAVDDGKGGWTTAALHVPGVADALAAARPRSRAVAISLKPRSALLPLGQHAGLAVWYDATRPGWKVNVDPRPLWVDRLEAGHPVKPLDYVWQPLDAAALAVETGHGDDMPGELGMHALGATFPHRLADADDPAKSVTITPYGSDLEVEAALAALAGADLGTDDEPDYLAISFSAHDYIGHAWGQESWEEWDAVHRLDAELDTLIGELDRRVGRDRWAMIVTSDHGAAPLVELTGGARHAYGDIEAIAEAAAAKIAGPGDWVADVHFPNLHLSAAALALPAETRDAVVDAILGALRATPWISRAERRDRYTGDCSGETGDDARLCWSIDPTRSGEIVFAPAGNHVLHENGEVDATDHGSFQPYDYQVPVIVIAPGAKPGTTDAVPVSMLRVTPTVTGLLRVPPPTAATEKSLLDSM